MNNYIPQITLYAITNPCPKLCEKGTLHTESFLTFGKISITKSTKCYQAQGKRSQHSRRMCNPQFYASGKRSMNMMKTLFDASSQKIHDRTLATELGVKISRKRLSIGLLIASMALRVKLKIRFCLCMQMIMLLFHINFKKPKSRADPNAIADPKRTNLCDILFQFKQSKRKLTSNTYHAF